MSDTEKNLNDLDTAATALTMMVDSARIIAGEMSEDFFEAFDVNSEAGRSLILAEFPRNRAKSFALLTLLRDMDEELRQIGYTR